MGQNNTEANNLNRPVHYLHHEADEILEIPEKIEFDQREEDAQDYRSHTENAENVESYKQTLFNLSASNERPTTLKTFLTPSERPENSLNQSRFSLKRSQTFSPQKCLQINHYEDQPYTSSRSTGPSPSKDKDGHRFFNNNSSTHSKSHRKSCGAKFEFVGKFPTSPSDMPKEFTYQSNSSVYKTPEANPSENYLYRTPSRYQLDLSAIMTSKSELFQARDFGNESSHKQIMLETEYLQTHSSAMKGSPKTLSNLISPSASLSHPRTRTMASPLNQESEIRYTNEKTSITEFESSFSGKANAAPIIDRHLQMKKDGRALLMTEENLKIENLPFEVIPEESLSNIDFEEVRKPEHQNSPQKMMLGSRLPDEEEAVGQEEMASPVRSTSEITVTKQKNKHESRVGATVGHTTFISQGPQFRELEEKVKHDEPSEKMSTEGELSPLDAASVMKRDEAETWTPIILENYDVSQSQEVALSSRFRNSIVEEEQQFGMSGIQCGLVTFELTNGFLCESPFSTTRSNVHNNKISLLKDDPNAFESPETTKRLYLADLQD